MAQTIRTALLGYGNVGPTHAEALLALPQSNFVAVGGRTTEKVEAFAGQYGVRAYTDLEQMLVEAGVDLLVIATPHPTHAGQIELAARHKVHVLVEKPLASDLADCDRAIAACRQAGVKLGVISQRRLYTVVVSGPGTIGLLTMQVVKAAGATVIVLGTSSDEERLAKARQLGADDVYNVETTDSLTTIRDMTAGLGADVVFECAGAGPSAQHCLELVRREGRYVQVGLFGKPITWDMDQVCYKELRMSGSNASVPSVWRKALVLLASGQVQTPPLISDVLPITDWSRAFERFEKRDGFKLLLTPVD